MTELVIEEEEEEEKKEEEKEYNNDGTIKFKPPPKTKTPSPKTPPIKSIEILKSRVKEYCKLKMRLDLEVHQKV